MTRRERTIYRRIYYERRIAEGRCVDCPAPAIAGMRRCLACKLRNADRERAWSERRRLSRTNPIDQPNRIDHS
jgi:hypothetical protein